MPAALSGEECRLLPWTAAGNRACASAPKNQNRKGSCCWLKAIGGTLGNECEHTRMVNSIFIPSTVHLPYCIHFVSSLPMPGMMDADFVHHGSYSLEKVLNFNSHLKKSLVKVLEKYLITYVGHKKSLIFAIAICVHVVAFLINWTILLRKICPPAKMVREQPQNTGPFFEVFYLQQLDGSPVVLSV